MELDEQGRGNVFRASEIDTFAMCPRKAGYARFGTVESPGPMRSPSNWAMLGGTSMDDTLTQHNAELIRGANGLRGSALTDYFVERFKLNTQQEAEKTGGPIGGEDNPDEIKGDGVRVLPIYEHDYAHVEPIAAQHESSWKIPAHGAPQYDVDHRPEITLVGHIDLIRRARHTDGVGSHAIISDYKFTKKSPGQFPASSYRRGWMYDLMAGDGGGAVELIYLRRGLKTPKVEQDSYTVTPSDHAQVKLAVRTAAGMVKAGLFPQTDPSNWMCNPKWCGMWSICRGRPGGPLPIPGESGVSGA